MRVWGCNELDVKMLFTHLQLFAHGKCDQGAQTTAHFTRRRLQTRLPDVNFHRICGLGDSIPQHNGRKITRTSCSSVLKAPYMENRRILILIRCAWRDLPQLHAQWEKARHRRFQWRPPNLPTRFRRRACDHRRCDRVSPSCRRHQRLLPCGRRRWLCHEILPSHECDGDDTGALYIAGEGHSTVA